MTRRMTRSYTVVVTFTTNAHTDEHLRTPKAIWGEFQSWLESLNATVRDINVTQSDERGERC